MPTSKLSLQFIYQLDYGLKAYNQKIWDFNNNNKPNPKERRLLPTQLSLDLPSNVNQKYTD